LRRYAISAKDGLYQYSIFNQANMLTASGGGSLIYSNVTMPAKKEARDRIGPNLSDAAARQWMEGPHNPLHEMEDPKCTSRSG
jgi:hypothetical protein